MLRYSCGFMIVPGSSPLDSQVLCIQKNRPAFQKGKWNGIGGKVEPMETPLEAQVREFREEAGVDTLPYTWEHTVTVVTSDYEVYYYRSIVPEFPAYRTMTDEWVSTLYVRNILIDLPVLDNMRWILPLQLTLNVKFPLVVQWQNLN